MLSADTPPANVNDMNTNDVFPPAEVNVSVSRGKKQPIKSTIPVPSVTSTAANSSSNTPGSSRKRKMNKQNFSATYKDMGRWKPVDDLLLIQGVLQV